MNQELEAILKSYDAFQEAAPEDAQRLYEVYQARLDDVLQAHKNLTRQALEEAIQT